MLSVQVVDGKGGASKRHITADGEALVSVSPYPPLKQQKILPFRAYLTDDGTAAGNTNMGIDGSVINVDYWVPAHEARDRYIARLSILVAYPTSGEPYEFADAAELANGSRLFYESIRGEVNIADGLTRNQDIFRLSDDKIDKNWEVRGGEHANDYAYMVNIGLNNMMPSFGLKLDAGTNQKLIMRIRDDATAATEFNIIAYGFDRFK